MTLPIDKRCEIVFLSQHPMDHSCVAKAVNCANNIVQYWLNRHGRARATTENVEQRICKLADSDNIATTGDVSTKCFEESKHGNQI